MNSIDMPFAQARHDLSSRFAMLGLLWASLAFSLISCRTAFRDSERFSQDTYLRPIQYDNVAAIPQASEGAVHAIGLHDRAVLLAKDFKLDEAESMLLAVLQRDASFLPAYMTLGRLYAIGKWKPPLRSLYGKAAANKGIDSAKLLAEATGLVRDGRRDEAIILLEEVYKTGRRAPEVAFLLGSLYEGVDDPLALYYYESAIYLMARNIYYGPHYDITLRRRIEIFSKSAESAGLIYSRIASSGRAIHLSLPGDRGGNLGMTELYKRTATHLSQARRLSGGRLAHCFEEIEGFYMAGLYVEGLGSALACPEHSISGRVLEGRLRMALNFRTDILWLTNGLDEQTKRNIYKQWYGTDDLTYLEVVKEGFDASY